MSDLRGQLIKEFPQIGQFNQIEKPKWTKSSFTTFSDNTQFKSYYDDFYKTNPVARASLIMNDLSKLSSGTQIEAAE